VARWFTDWRCDSRAGREHPQNIWPMEKCQRGLAMPEVSRVVEADANGRRCRAEAEPGPDLEIGLAACSLGEGVAGVGEGTPFTIGDRKSDLLVEHHSRAAERDAKRVAESRPACTPHSLSAAGLEEEAEDRQRWSALRGWRSPHRTFDASTTGPIG
jgi:hypothetical protein